MHAWNEWRNEGDFFACLRLRCSAPFICTFAASLAALEASKRWTRVVSCSLRTLSSSSSCGRTNEFFLGVSSGNRGITGEEKREKRKEQKMSERCDFQDLKGPAGLLALWFHTADPPVQSVLSFSEAQEPFCLPRVKYSYLGASPSLR